ncbi:hypothetical protein PIB30_001349 [Stylosanthes scabra]|uniref:Transposase (Putative), gypsy type n=1 Tax=Stylosanthes scabra TaxID=79078 RepID=A0ABU6Y285_9FABA|nr:hypothetical protein [Stylosanthes scabra]
MGKKKSCQELKIPRPLDAAETRLYGWVEEAVLTQPSVVKSDSLPEFRRNFPLIEDSGAEGDYVLEAVGPSDRVPFRAGEGGPHFLWVYQELFTRLRMRLPFSDFQRDMMTRCRVAVSQLHLNGWDFIIAFEKVCIHYGFRPTIRLFFYIYDVHFPPGGYGYISFRARQGRKLFDSYEDSFQEFKWILDSSDAKVGKYLDDLLDVKMKKIKLDNLMAMIADPSRMGPRAVLPTGSPSATATAAAAAAAASTSAAGSTLVESSSQVPPAPTASETHRTKRQSSKCDRAKVVNLEGEEGLQEDPAADLQQKRRKKKAKVDDAFEKALGGDSAWEHDVDPLKVAFPGGFNFRKSLKAGLTSTQVREALIKMPPEQLLGESYHLSAKSLACLQVGVETSMAAKVKAEKELSTALDQIEVLKGERDSDLVYLPLKEKVDNLDNQLSERTAEYRSALDRIALLEEDNRADLSKATEASEYWRSEWQKLGTESRWDPKGRRIFVPQGSDVEEELSQAEEVVPEQHPGVTTLASQPAAGDMAGVSGECPT